MVDRAWNDMMEGMWRVAKGRQAQTGGGNRAEEAAGETERKDTVMGGRALKNRALEAGEDGGQWPEQGMP